MSFALTPEEQTRVETAAFLGLHLDPIGYVDLSTILVLSTMYLIEFIALCYQLHHRNYLPLKVKNMPIMFSLYLGGVSWFLGDIFTGGLVHLRQSPVLRNCKLTIIWLRACIGAYYVTSIFALRCYSLYYVFRKGKAYNSKALLWSLGVAVASILLFGVVSTLVPEEMTTYYEEIMDLCYISREYIIAVLTVIWSIWLYTAIMTWRMRKVPFCFNERTEMATTFCILLLVSVVNTVCLLVITVYPASLAWRTSLLYVNHVGASVGYWVVMGVPTYHCIFNREEYLQRWIQTLKQDHMEREYDYSSHNNNETIINLSEFTEIPSKANSNYTSSQNHTADDGMDSANMDTLTEQRDLHTGDIYFATGLSRKHELV